MLQRWSGRALRPGFGRQHSYHSASASVRWLQLCWPGSAPPGPSCTWSCLCLSSSVCRCSCRHPPTFPWPDLLVFTVKAAVFFVCLSSSIPESPRWLLLKKRLDVLERYRNNSPKDKRFLDLVTRQTLWFQLLNIFSDSSNFESSRKKTKKNQNNPKKET